MKATKQFFPVVLFIMLYKVILTCESVDETVKLPSSTFLWFCISFLLCSFLNEILMWYQQFQHNVCSKL